MYNTCGINMAHVDQIKRQLTLTAYLKISYNIEGNLDIFCRCCFDMQRRIEIFVLSLCSVQTTPVTQLSLESEGKEGVTLQPKQIYKHTVNSQQITLVRQPAKLTYFPSCICVYKSLLPIARYLREIRIVCSHIMQFICSCRLRIWCTQRKNYS